MTWGEIKLITLQKMFEAPDGKIEVTDSTKEYLNAMPGAANEGLSLLATAGRYIKKRKNISQDGSDDEPQRYDFSRLTPDFYSFDEDQVFHIGEDGAQARFDDFEIEGESVLVLSPELIGDWRVYYNAYPPRITGDTKDEYELPLYPEVAALLPLYLASQLYKDDDIGMATQYRNEFEVGREALLTRAQAGTAVGKERFKCATGWW